MKESSEKLIDPNRALFAHTLLALLLLAAGGGEVCAQNENAPARPSVEMREPGARRGDEAMQLLRILNLTPEQRAQIGMLRRETGPQVRSLNMRLRQARRALDEAIYSDNPEDGIVEERARAVGAAQAAIMRLRALTELKIRRVLTPEQLSAFRGLHREARTRLRPNQRRMQGGDAPVEVSPQFRNRMRPLPPSPPSNDPDAAPSPTPGTRRRPPFREGRITRP